MRLIAVSDLHITGPEDPLYASLLTLIGEARGGDRLVLAGDVFDLFVGNKEIFRERYSRFIAACREAAARGASVDYIEGNHDFHLKDAFSELENFHVHSNEVTFSLGSTRFIVEHGDRVDTGDLGYQALRLFFRSPVMKGLVRLSPGKWLDAIGKKSSAASGKRKPRLPYQLSADEQHRLRKAYRNHAVKLISSGFDIVIMGHCHDLDEMKFQLGGRAGHYANVGYPRVHGSYLLWDEAGGLRRERLPGAPEMAVPTELRR